MLNLKRILSAILNQMSAHRYVLECLLKLIIVRKPNPHGNVVAPRLDFVRLPIQSQHFHLQVQMLRPLLRRAHDRVHNDARDGHDHGIPAGHQVQRCPREPHAHAEPCVLSIQKQFTVQLLPVQLLGVNVQLSIGRLPLQRLVLYYSWYRKHFLGAVSKTAKLATKWPTDSKISSSRRYLLLIDESSPIIVVEPEKGRSFCAKCGTKINCRRCRSRQSC